MPMFGVVLKVCISNFWVAELLVQLCLQRHATCDESYKVIHVWRTLKDRCSESSRMSIYFLPTEFNTCQVHKNHWQPRWERSGLQSWAVRAHGTLDSLAVLQLLYQHILVMNFEPILGFGFLKHAKCRRFSSNEFFKGIIRMWWLTLQSWVLVTLVIYYLVLIF